jgi:hypothetical protein
MDKWKEETGTRDQRHSRGRTEGCVQAQDQRRQARGIAQDQWQSRRTSQETAAPQGKCEQVQDQRRQASGIAQDQRSRQMSQEPAAPQGKCEQVQDQRRQSSGIAQDQRRSRYTSQEFCCVIFKLRLSCHTPTTMYYFGAQL